jgi:glycosyl transferase family 87
MQESYVAAVQPRVKVEAMIVTESGRQDIPRRFFERYRQRIAGFLPPSQVHTASRWRTWLPLAVILCVAAALRFGYMRQPGFQADMVWNARRATAVYHVGLFNLYRVVPSDYPPVYLSILGIVGAFQNWLGLPQPPILTETVMTLDDPTLMFLLKVFPVAGDLLLIGVVYAWLRRDRVWRWIIPGALAVTPALIFDSALWGQSDSLMVLLVVLSLIALNRDKPRAAWCFFAVGMLIKFQSVVILPLLLVLTFRRYGFRALAMGGVLALALMAALVLPFAVQSGPEAALTPYVGAVGAYPAATVNAFNLWYILTPHQPGTALPWPDDQSPDTLRLLGPLTMKQIGLLLMGSYALLIMATAWFRPDDRREFVLAAALYFAFFMLPTEIHERYLYPALVLLIAGIAQDRRAWPLAVGTALTFTYNLGLVFDQHWLVTLFAVQASLINVALLVEVTRLALRGPASQALTLRPAATTL